MADPAQVRMWAHILELLIVGIIVWVYTKVMQGLVRSRMLYAWIMRVGLCLLGISSLGISCLTFTIFTLQYMYRSMPEMPVFSDVPWGLGTALVLWAVIACHVMACCGISNSWGPYAKHKLAEVDDLLRRCSDPGKAASGAECPICCGSLADSRSLRAPPCRHTFHQECLQKWLLRRPTCPVCRYDLTEFPV